MDSRTSPSPRKPHLSAVALLIKLRVEAESRRMRIGIDQAVIVAQQSDSGPEKRLRLLVEGRVVRGIELSLPAA